MTWSSIHEHSAQWGLAALSTLLHTLLLLALAHLLQRAGWLAHRPAVWSVLWALVAASAILPWAPQIPGSLADVAAHVHDGRQLAARFAGADGAPAPSPWWTLAFGAWASLAVVGVVVRLAAVRRRWRAVAALDDAPADVDATARELAARLSLSPRGLSIKLAQEPATPHVLAGPWRAVIVLPAQLVDAPALVRLALAHELAHLRRRDALARWICALAAAVWFFVPLRRLLGAPLERSQEQAADALACRALALPPTTYARDLLAATQRGRGGSEGWAGALGLATGAALHDRVVALCSGKVAPGLGRLGAAWVVAFAVLGLGRATAPALGELTTTCEYDTSIAEALREVHPEADLDGDGELGRDEACALQEQLRRSARQGLEPGQEVSVAPPLWDRLCCECDGAAEQDRIEPAACGE